MNKDDFIIRRTSSEDKHFAKTITKEIEESAKARGTGIAQRSVEYIEQKIEQGNAVIACTQDGDWVGFCYIEEWGHGKYVANSGLIVSLDYRKTGVAKKIKRQIFHLSREKYPNADARHMPPLAAGVPVLLHRACM